MLKRIIISFLVSFMMLLGLAGTAGAQISECEVGCEIPTTALLPPVLLGTDGPQNKLTIIFDYDYTLEDQSPVDIEFFVGTPGDDDQCNVLGNTPIVTFANVTNDITAGQSPLFSLESTPACFVARTVWPSGEQVAGPSNVITYFVSRPEVKEGGGAVLGASTSVTEPQVLAVSTLADTGQELTFGIMAVSIMGMTIITTRRSRA